MNRPFDRLGENCRRFQDLVERRWVDEECHSQVDTAWMSRHQKECHECDEFMKLIESATEVDDEDMARDNFSEREAIRKLVNSSFENRPKKRRFIIPVAAAVALVVTGIAVVTLYLSSKTPIQEGRFQVLAGKLQISDRTLTSEERFDLIGKEIRPVGNNALLGADGSLFVAMKQDSTLRVERSETDEIRLHLASGRIAVHLKPGSGIGLSVDVPNGTVAVVGTVFIVEVEKGETIVEVVRGEVAVESPSFKKTPTTRLAGGYSFAFSSEYKKPRIPKENDPLLALIGVSEESEIKVVAVEPVLREPGEVKTVDPPPEEEKTVESPTNEKPKLPFEEQKKREPLRDLLRKARSCRANRDWICAEESYRELIREYPKLPDSTTALVPLAQILLEHTSKREEALLYFSRYVERRPKGGLAPEAEWGKCNALRKLSRYGEEQRCLRDYLKKYPDSLNAPIAQYRLEEI